MEGGGFNHVCSKYLLYYSTLPILHQYTDSNIHVVYNITAVFGRFERTAKRLIFHTTLNMLHYTDGD